MKNRWKYAVIMLLTVMITAGCDQAPVQETGAKEPNSVGKIEIHDAKAKHLTDEFQSETNVLIRVDANVPENMAAAPDVVITAREITVDEVKHWAKVFLGEQELYEADGYHSWFEVEEQINWMKERAEDRDALLDAYGGDEDAVDALIDYYNQQLEQLMTDYYSGNGFVSQPMENWTFREHDYYWDEGNYWSEMGYMDSDDYTNRQMAFKGKINGNVAQIAAVNDLNNEWSSLSFWQTGVLPDNVENERLLSQEDVIRLTDDKVYQLTGMEWRLSEIQNRGNIWRVIYVPPGEDMTADDQYFLEVSSMNDQMNTWNGDTGMPYMNYEHLIMDVCGDQIIAARYECPMTVEADGSKQAELLSLYRKFRFWGHKKETHVHRTYVR